MSIKKSINLIRAVHNAGFKLVGSKSVGTDDGACWEATLAQGTTKLVRVSNGGTGGPDETFFLETQKLSISAIKTALNRFFAVPEVQQVVQDYQIDLKRYELDYKHITQDDFDKFKAATLATPVVPSGEAIEISVQSLADASETLKVIKRSLKTHICATKDDDDEKGAWRTWKAADTPENRAFILKKHNVDYFLADLIAGL